MTQKQMFYHAHRRLADFYLMLSETQASENPFTAQELRASKAKGLPIPDAMIKRQEEREVKEGN